MSKRLLFIAADPVDVENLNRAIDSQAGIWAIEYALDGVSALELMEKDPFVAVIANSNLRDMPGAEFLNQVLEKHPESLRFITSSSADQKLIMECVSGTHQFIPKPYDAKDLLITIRQSLTLDGWLSNKKIRELVSRLEQFPSLPSAYFDLVKSLESPLTMVQEIGDLIARDLAVSAKLLHLVNSAFFGLPEKITNISEAVAILGTEAVKSLIITIHVLNQSDQTSCEGFSIDELWDHSIDVAGWAKSLAWAETGDQKLSEEAFTAGLLHDVGKLVLASNLPEDYEKAVELAQTEHMQMWKAESEVFQATHAETGAYLLGLWGMPVTLVEAVALHHFPNRCFSNEFSSLTAVHVADALIHDQESASEGGADSLLDMDYLKKLGLDDRVDHWKAVLQQEEHDTAFILHRQIPESAAVPSVADVKSPIQKLTKEQKRRMVLIPAVAGLGFIFLFLIFVGIYSFLENRANFRQIELKEFAMREEEFTDLTTQKEMTDETSDSVETVEAVFKPSENLNLKPLTKVLTELKLEGILFNKNLSIAIINGRILRVGDTINEASVLEIKPDRIKLVVGNDEKILLLDQAD